jgi:5-methylcytosine-specific restriction protein A
MEAVMAWPSTSRQSRGYGASWDRLRLRILARDKHLCQACLIKGRAVPGNHVDHIKPKSQGGTDDEGNLQVLCRACHDAKTLTDEGKRVKPRTGIDGWPVQD